MVDCSTMSFLNISAQKVTFLQHYFNTKQRINTLNFVQIP